jgi:hypothetical protein
MVVVVQPDVVRLRDICQPVDGIQYLRHAPLVLVVHDSQQIYRLRQRLMAFREFFETFVNAHGCPPEPLIITVRVTRDVSCMHGA